MVTAEKTNTRISIEEITNILNEFLNETYGLHLNIPIDRNNRLSRSMGRYAHDWDDVPLRIEISGFLLDYGSREIIIDVMKHEAIHYALHMLGKPNEDGDEYFENELRKQGVVSTGKLFVGLVYVLNCDECSEEILTRYKRVAKNLQQYTSGCCKSRMAFVEERIYDGTEVFE